MSQKTRGEATITLGGEDYKMVTTHTAIDEIEDRLGMGIVAFYNEIARYNVRQRQLAIAISCLVEGLSEVKASVLIHETGQIVVMAELSEFLSEALSGGGDDKDGDSKNGEAQRK